MALRNSFNAMIESTLGRELPDVWATAGGGGLPGLSLIKEISESGFFIVSSLRALTGLVSGSVEECREYGTALFLSIKSNNQRSIWIVGAHNTLAKIWAQYSIPNPKRIGCAMFYPVIPFR